MKRLSNKILILAFILMLSAAFIYAQKTETIDGVRVTHNPKQGLWGENPQVTLTFVKNLGELDSEDENVLFHMPEDIAFDNEGNIYVLDGGNQRIQKFDASGNYLATLSRKGEGPGELQFPLSLDIDSNGYMYIPDMGNQRIQVLKPSGVDHKGITMGREAVGEIRLFSSGDMLKGGGGFIIMGPGSMEAKTPPPLFKVLDPEGKVKAELGIPHNYKDFMLNTMGNRTHYTIDKNDNIFVAFEFQNRIDKYSSDGKLLWKSDRELNYDTKKPRSKGSRRSSGGNISIQAPQMNRCSNGIALDEKGRIWVVGLERQMKEEEQVQMRISRMASGGSTSTNLDVSGNTDLRETDMYRLEVYDPEGVLLGIFPLEHFVDDIRIHKDRIFLLDKLRGAQFYEYKIQEK